MIGLISYFAFAAAAVAGLFVLLRSLGQGTTRDVSHSDAIAALNAIYEDPSAAAHFSAGSTHIFALENGSLGIVRPLGHRVVANTVGPGGITRVRGAADGVEIRFADFTHPIAVLPGVDVTAVREWLEAHSPRQLDPSAIE